MERSRLVLGLAVVFAGLTILLAVLAVMYGEVLVVLVAAPFAVVTYFFWYQATGRIYEDVRSHQVGGSGAMGRGVFGAGPRGGRVPPGERRRRRRKRAHEAYWRARQARDERGHTSRQGDSRSSFTRPADAEAYRVLGVEVGADEATVREAYRDRVKDVHPDRGGDEATFKRVTDAYERLTEE